MAWRIEIDKDVQRSMKKLDKQIARRIVAKLHEISQLEDPRSMGKGLTEISIIPVPAAMEWVQNLNHRTIGFSR